MNDETISPTRRSLISAIAVAVVGTLLLFGLGAISLVYSGPVVVVVWIFGFLAFHYLTWGWWLSRSLRARLAEGEDV